VREVVTEGDGAIGSLAWSPDRRLLAAVDDLGGVRYLDVGGWRQVGHTQDLWPNPIIGLAFVDDGWLIHGNVSRRRAFIRPVSADVQVEAACALAGRNLTSDEWLRYRPGDHYRATCAHWPPAEEPLAPVTSLGDELPDAQPLELGSADGDGDDERDALAESCRAGDMQACDDLYEDSLEGSAYEVYGDTCAGRRPPRSIGYCVDTFGTAPPTT
jgi:hypothetical protein